jgi:hypothetical protein
LVPVILVVQALARMRILKGTADLTPQDVQRYLRDFLDGTGGDWDWTDFTSVPITDPMLASIREQAARVALPLDNVGQATLEQLWADTTAMIKPPHSPAPDW